MSKVVTDFIDLGDDYDKVRKVYSINIVYVPSGFTALVLIRLIIFISQQIRRGNNILAWINAPFFHHFGQPEYVIAADLPWFTAKQIGV